MAAVISLCWVAKGRRLLQASDSLPLKRIVDPLRRCISRCICVCVSCRCRTGSEACRIFVRRFWGGRAPVRRLGCTRSLHLSSHPRAGRCRENNIPSLPWGHSRCDLCVMIDRLCYRALRNTCLSRLCARSARSTPRGRTSVPDNIGQSQSRQASMSPAKAS